MVTTYRAGPSLAAAFAAVILVAGAVAPAVLAQAPSAGPVDLAPGVFWIGGYGAPRIPMVGDADADGRADFLGLYPPDQGILDLVPTSRLGKPRDLVQARKPFGADAIAVACADFDGKPGVEVVALLPEGDIHAASSLDTTKFTYQRDDVVGVVPEPLRPSGPARALVGDFDGDGRVDMLVLGSDGRAVMLHNVGKTDGFALIPCRVDGAPKGAKRVAAGAIADDGRARLVWIAEDGVASSCRIDRGADGVCRCAPAVAITKASPDDGLAVGRFRGAVRADVIVGKRLLPSGSEDGSQELPNLPSTEASKTDLVWLAGDFDGDGRDDLLRVRRSGESETGDDLVLHVAHVQGQAPSIADTDGDGLLDSWEDGTVKPGDLDLRALGCSPGKQDVIVEVQPFEKVPKDKLHSEMDRIIAYYASLPTENPDGSKGIALHVIYRDPIPTARESESWGTLGAEFHPANHRGIAHWMLIGPGGGGQSGQMADRGSCGVAACYATFIHEFGHQLGLDHTGHWAPAWCPTYPSLMNYAYSYQLGGDPKRIGYSTGKLVSLVLNEQHLSERLPFAMDDVSFLSGPPYHYQLRPAPDGKGTWVDWNWNDTFGEEDICADINYGYSTNAGARHHVGKSRGAPALAAHGDGDSAKLLVFGETLVPQPAPAAGEKKPDEPPKAAASDQAQPPEKPKTETPPQPPAPEHKRLYVRAWLGSDPDADGDKWTDEVALEPDGLLSDPSAVYYHGTTWVAYGLADGVHLRPVRVDTDGRPTCGDATLVPDSTGAEPTLIRFDGALLLLMWRDAKTPVQTRRVVTQGDTASAEAPVDLPLTSLVPVGAAEGPRVTRDPSLWIGLTEDQDAPRPSRWQVRRLERAADGSFTQLEKEWVEGQTGGARGRARVLLLCEPSSDFPTGQVLFYQCGLWAPEHPWSCHYVAARVRSQDIRHGWLVRRYYDEWSESRSAPAVCFFHGDIAYAMRWNAPPGSEPEDNLNVTFWARGIDRKPMGDFDDVTFIRTIGETHSIPVVGQ